MHPRFGPDNLPLRLILVFFILALCLGLAGYLYYTEQKKQIKHKAEDELFAVADLKVGQVASWRREQFDDAALLAASPLVTPDIASRIRSGDPVLARDIRLWMRTIRSGHRYKALLLLDPQGVALLADPAEQNAIGPDGMRLARAAFATGNVTLSELYQSKIVPETRCSLLVPLFNRLKTNKSKPIAVLLIRIDPSDFLYPLIQTWPGTSPTAETLLLRREHDDAVLLNEARHRKHTPLTFRVPLKKKPALAALLDSGGKGIIEMNDYRDVPVIAVIQPVPDTPWFLVAKVDREEIYSSVQRQAIFLATVVLALIAATGLIIFLWWRHQMSEQSRLRAASELALKSISTRYDLLSKFANDIIVVADQNGKIIEVNDRAVTAYGYSRYELLQMGIHDLLPPNLRSDVAATMKAVAVQKGMIFESTNLRKDGAVFPVEVSSRLMEAGDIKLYLNILRDITERKSAENKILHVTGLYAFLSQVNQTIVRAEDRGGLFENICKIAVDYGGFKMAWIGLAASDNGGAIAPAAFWGAEQGYITDLARTSADKQGNHAFPQTANLEASHYVCNDVRKDPRMNLLRDTLDQQGYRSSGEFLIKQHNTVIGSLHVYSSESDFFSNAGIKLLDEVALNISFALDNLERERQRKESSDALKARTAFIEAILDNLPLGLSVNRVSDGKLLYLNTAFESTYGWPREKIASVDMFFECVYPDPAYREKIRERVLADIASRDHDRMRWENIAIITENGEKRRITAINIPLLEQDLMISTVQDVTGRHEADVALLESRRRFERLVESVTDYIYTVRIEDGRVVSTSHGPSCVSVTGYTSEEYETDHGLWLRMVFEEDRELVAKQSQLIVSGTPVAPFEHRLIHKDGSLRWVRNTPVPRYNRDGRLTSYDGLITDITAIKTLENQLRQAQKMEAVGQLAGGVAHDFNNILTAIIGYANLLLMKMQGDDSGRPFVDQILSSAERAGHLTHSLLTFSRKQIIDLRPVNLNEIIRRVEKLLVRVIGEDIEFRTRLGNELIILADSIQIEQILMNLATNARDAMPNGGTLEIKTDIAELGEEFVRSHSYAKPGIYSVISVTDTGIGMDETVRHRIFEPFFTTKPMGKGTGLGLAMVYGIVKQHSGYIHVYSEPNHGTTFKIYLPLSTAAVAVASRPDAGTLAGGNETVLLVEDDWAVRAMSKKVLEDFGYRVVEAADGEEAVRVFKENRERVDLLILDIIMPKKNGKETYEEIRTMRPAIKALFTSGYTADIIEQKGFIDTGLDFIGKPSTPAVLLQKVREILDTK